MINRRALLVSAATTALSVGIPVGRIKAAPGGDLAPAPGGAFNGGRSQGAPGFPFGTDFIFANLMKSATQNFTRGSDGHPFPPDGLDAKGYPSAAWFAANPTNSANKLIPVIPSKKSNPISPTKPLVITWEGNATLGSFFTHAARGYSGINSKATLDRESGKYKGRHEFYIDYFEDPRDTGKPAGSAEITLTIFSIAPGSYVDNVQLYIKDEEINGVCPMFGKRFLEVMRYLNYGVIRFLDWMLGSVATTSTWDTRKTQSYHDWYATEFRAALYAGITTNTGNDYSVTIPAGYSWSSSLGTYVPGSVPPDKMVIHLGYNVDSTVVANSTSNRSVPVSGIPSLTIASYNPLVFNWPSCPLVNGDPITITSTGATMIGMPQVQTYYVIHRGVGGTDRFGVTLSPGGTAFGTKSTSIPRNSVGQVSDVNIVRDVTLNIGTGAIPIRNLIGSPRSINWAAGHPDWPKGSNNSSFQYYATLTYDATFNVWFSSGGNYTEFSSGIQNGVPIEVCFELCRQLGAHPYWTIPMYALDPMTDFSDGLARYNIANNPGWMVPRFEPANEVWNWFLLGVTLLGWNRAELAWGVSQAHDAWYGKITSTLGQQIANNFGGATNRGVTYELLSGSQYQTSSTNFPDDRLASNTYINQSQPAQAGYVKDHAYNYVSAMLSANYTSTSQYLQPKEVQNAWDWWVTFAGNPRGQQTPLNDYILSMPDAAHPLAYYVGTKAFGTKYGIKKMKGYEGGFSEDLVSNTARFWSAPLAAAPTKASQCMVTIPVTFTPVANNGSSTLKDIAPKAGMVLGFQGVPGMMELNTDIGVSARLPVGGSSISTPNRLRPGQIVIFRKPSVLSSELLPPNITYNMPYHVLASGLSSLTFQIATTPGGVPITFGGVNSPKGKNYYSATFDSGWSIASIDTTAKTATLNCDSSGFSTGSTGGTALLLGSCNMIDEFRRAAIQDAEAMYQRTKDNYAAFALAGGDDPSQFQIAADDSAIWGPIYPDIWATMSQEARAIHDYNNGL